VVVCCQGEVRSGPCYVHHDMERSWTAAVR
jgi:hypothetical protein